MEKVLITAGIACILAAILGGGLKAFNIEIPVLRSRLKQIAIGLLGICFIYAGVKLASASKPEGGILIALEIGQANNSPVDDQVMHQIMQTLDKRLEGFGIEKGNRTIRHENNKISISLNNTKFSMNLLEILSKQARLEFKARDESIDESILLQYPLPKVIKLKAAEEEVLLTSLKKQIEKQIPPHDEILFEKVLDKKTKSPTKRPVIVERKILMTGDKISDAKVALDSISHEPYISLTFSTDGAKIFEQVTAANIGKRLAIILDDTVYSSPVVRERVTGGEAQITGVFTTEEAQNMAIALRAGALPTQVTVTEVSELTKGLLWKLLELVK